METNPLNFENKIKIIFLKPHLFYRNPTLFFIPLACKHLNGLFPFYDKIATNIPQTAYNLLAINELQNRLIFNWTHAIASTAAACVFRPVPGTAPGTHLPMPRATRTGGEIGSPLFRFGSLLN